MWNLKNKTNKTKTDSQIQRGEGWGMKWAKGIKRYKLPVTK